MTTAQRYINQSRRTGKVITPSNQKKDVVTDDGTIKISATDSNGNFIDVQNPIQISGDRVYAKDVKDSLNVIGTFTKYKIENGHTRKAVNADIETLFNNLDDVIIDDSTNNPKWFEFFLEAPVSNGSININTSEGNFSNVKIILKNRQDIEIKAIDDSDNNEKYENNPYPLTTKNYCCVRIEFHTNDTISISGIFIQKNISVVIDAIDGFISAKNSSLIPLDALEVFEGAAEDSKDYGSIQVALYSDAACTFQIFGRSTKTSTWREFERYDVVAGEDKSWSFQGVRRFIKTKVTCGPDAQGVGGMDFQTVFKPVYIKPSSHPIGGKIKSNDDAELVKAQTTGEKPDGTYANVGVTESENLKYANKEDALNIAQGNVVGVGSEHKFGRGANIDTADGFVVLWDGAEYNDALKVYTYSPDNTADIDRISSDNNNDTEPIEIIGLDANGDLVTQTKTLTGQTPVALDTSLWRVFRLENIGTSDLLGNAFCFVNVATTLGVPDTLTNIRAMIGDGNNQTLMALYTVPNNITAYMISWFGALSSAKASSFNNFEIRARPFGSVFKLKHTSTLSSAGTSHIQHAFVVPQDFPAKTDFAMLSDSSVNDNAVSAGFDLILIDD